MYIDRPFWRRAARQSRFRVDPHLAAGYLPTLQSIVAVTRNDCAVMTTTGCYASVKVGSGPVPGLRGLVLQFEADTVSTAITAPADHSTGTPPSITFEGSGGDVLHRCLLTSSHDEMVLDALRLANPVAVPHTPARIAPARVLPFRAQPASQQIVDRQVIPHLLAYLAELRLPMAMAACHLGCTHLSFGALDDLRREGDLLFVYSGLATLSFDPAQIASWQVEASAACDAENRLLAVSARGEVLFHLTCAGERNCNAHESWRAIVASLPTRAARC